MAALEKAGIQVDEYVAYEIDKSAIKVSESNYGQIEHCGDVTAADFGEYKGFDLLIGGSPCQGFSFAGKGLNFNDPRSRLFFEFVRALEEVQPEYFMLENVVMKKEWRDIITEHMGGGAGADKFKFSVRTEQGTALLDKYTVFRAARR